MPRIKYWRKKEARYKLLAKQKQLRACHAHDTKSAESCPPKPSSPPSLNSESGLDGVVDPSRPLKHTWKQKKTVSVCKDTKATDKILSTPVSPPSLHSTQDDSSSQYSVFVSSRGRVIKFRPDAKLYKNPPRPKSKPKSKATEAPEVLHLKPASATATATIVTPKFNLKHAFPESCPQQIQMHSTPVVSLMKSLPPRLERPVLSTGLASKLMPKLSLPPNFRQESQVVMPAVAVRPPQLETKSERQSVLSTPTLFLKHNSSLNHLQESQSQTPAATPAPPPIENQPRLQLVSLGDSTPNLKDAVQPLHQQKTSGNFSVTKSASPSLEHPPPPPRSLSLSPPPSTIFICKPTNGDLLSTQPQLQGETLNSSLELLANIASIVSTQEGKGTDAKKTNHTALREPPEIKRETLPLGSVAVDCTKSAEVFTSDVTLPSNSESSQSRALHMSPTKLPPHTHFCPHPYAPLHTGLQVRPKLQPSTVIPIQVLPRKESTSVNPVTVKVNSVNQRRMLHAKLLVTSGRELPSGDKPD